jgi:glucose/arabinose dehydrogenase
MLEYQGSGSHMKWQLLTGAGVTCLAILSASLAAQAQPAPNPAQIGDPTGTPPGIAPMQNRNSTGFPTPRTMPGEPVETRMPEKLDDHPVFPGQTRAPYKASVPITVTTLTDKLKSPWSLAFLPDGNMLITEKGGTLRISDPEGSLSEPLTGVPKVLATGQVGLLDVALDPHFADNHRIFLSYSEPVGESYSNIAIASARLDGHALTDVKPIFRAKPALPARALSANSGGRIAIDRDGNLFATIGDRSKSPPWLMAQQLDTDLGKMIHITPNGDPAPNNPFIGKTGVLPEIWSSGHRSEEGLTVDPATGRLWEVEDGPRGGDELNTPEAGKNYGWPVITHAIDYPGETIGEGIVEQPGMEQPHYYWDPVIAPSGLVIYHGKMFPQWEGNALIGALRGQMLDRVEIKDDKVVAEEPLLVDQHQRIRDVRIGPEGAVYVISDEGKLMKITPK